jgi:hypothetical protein
VSPSDVGPNGYHDGDETSGHCQINSSDKDDGCFFDHVCHFFYSPKLAARWQR